MIKSYIADADGNELPAAWRRTEASCDSCKADIVWREGRHESVNCAALKPSFGYGSPIDGLGLQSIVEFHLCEACTAKAIDFLKLTPLLNIEDQIAIQGILEK